MALPPDAPATVRQGYRRPRRPNPCADKATLLAQLVALPPSDNVEQIRGALAGSTSIELALPFNAECDVLAALAAARALASVQQLHIEGATNVALSAASYLSGLPALLSLK
jgi:hypothetical protein